MPGLTLSAPKLPLVEAAGRLAVRPTDMPVGHASGPSPYRVLLLGTEAVAGYGVRSHSLSLAGCLARTISGSTGFGADVELLMSERPALGQLDAVLRQQPVGQLDGVVLVLDQGRHPRVGTSYCTELRALLIALLDRLPDGARIVVAAAPSMPGSATHFGRDADRFAKSRATIAAAVRPFASFVALPDSAGRLARDLYRSWAEVIGAAFLPALQEPRSWRNPVEHLHEATRQAAVERLGTLDPSWEAEFERFVSFARAGYGTRFASLSVLDGPRTRFLARQGFEVEDLPREDTLCNTVVARPGGIIVGDTRRDERFRHLPPVQADAAVFYAGYRVKSPDGQPVAVLCAFDPEPRPVLGQDLVLLRDLALAAQQRLWELGRPAHR